MNRRQVVTGLAVIVALVLAIVVTYATNANAQPEGLLNASDADIERAALEYTNTYFEPKGAIVTLMIRSVTKEEIPGLGLPAIDFSGQDPPLSLVALKGEFDVHRLSRQTDNGPRPATYIVYVFDLRAGAPTLIVSSPDGAHFRTLLNDPTLPDYLEKNQTSVRESGVPSAVPLAPNNKLPYGAVAPTVSSPSVAAPIQ